MNGGESEDGPYEFDSDRTPQKLKEDAPSNGCTGESASTHEE